MPLLFGLILFLILLPVLPVMAMRFMRKRRHKRFGIQLPEALELITRGLKAGHPVPVAIAMVAREMPDPIGTEFGVIADEVTYGSDLVSALNSLFDRVGHEDLPLFVTAVSIQTSSRS
ncbi:type II secretion system F family protein, partial [Mesorhizobium sp. M8A.F.Ca.ET.213.01.1.1]|uniref:type II secretion system F family protein n=1 Tax=Mesorhizobium sp. M8A.F.Ca.ET.213.01.1.1 TaxID=2563970 RepID=UPI00387E6CB4